MVGFLDVGTGGIVNLDGGTLNLGNQLSSVSGTVNVDGGNLVLAGSGNLRTVTGGELNINSSMFDAGNNDVSIDGGSTANLHFTNATIDLGVNRSHTVANNATLNTFGSFDLTDSTELTVRGGGDLNAQTLRVGLNNPGAFDDAQLTVTNSGSSLVTTFDTFVGDTGGAGVITVSDQATAAFGSLVIAGASDNGTQGTVNLETGATATAGFVFISDADADRRVGRNRRTQPRNFRGQRHRQNRHRRRRRQHPRHRHRYVARRPHRHHRRQRHTQS